ncbi:MAG: hypothetical protein PWP23_839 [Candidatus Sumerlaeota bacterium]|nr:hypothetical protein [Candidatus Sumerlaeota bacterium]
MSSHEQVSADFPKDLPPDPETSYLAGRSTRWSGTDQTEQTLSQWRVHDSSSSSRSRGFEKVPSATIPSTFILRRQVDRGGFGEVWEAVQTSLDRIVAVKKIQEKHYDDLIGLEEDQYFLEYQFRQEALLTAQLDHPNIVPVHDLGSDERGRPLLAMKLVRGRPWSEIIREDAKSLSHEDLLNKHLAILIDMAQAVAFAHSRGIVHRDLKPSQVMVGEFGEVLLMDWGLAIYVADPQKAPSGTYIPRISDLPTPQTATSPAGTPSLMSPEQTGSSAQNITPLTDIYLLGGTLYYLLTGTYPHEAKTSRLAMEKARRGLVEPPEKRVRSSRIPEPLSRLAMKCLAANPQERLPSAEAFIEGIRAYLSGALNRQDSVELTQRVEARLARLKASHLMPATSEEFKRTRTSMKRREATETYQEYTECLNLLNRALACWPLNPEVERLRSSILTSHSWTALAFDDLTLARVAAGNLVEAEPRRELLAAIDVREQQLAAERRRWRTATALAAVLSVLLAGLTAKYLVDQKATNHALAVQRDEAKNAQRIAEQARGEAMLQREAALQATELALEQKALADKARQSAVEEAYFSMLGIAEASIEQGRWVKADSILLEQIPEELRQWEWGYLLQRLHPENLQFLHEAIYHAVYTPGGDKVVTGDSRRVALWDAETGRQLWETETNTDLLWTVAMTSDGQWISAASRDTTGVVLDAKTGEIVHRLEGHTEHLRGTAIHGPTKRVLTSSADETIRIWDLETGAHLRTITGFSDDVYDVSFSADGSRILAASLDSRVTLWDTATGELIHEYPGHSGRVLTAVFTPDEAHVLTAGREGIVRIFNTETTELVHTVSKDETFFHDVAVSPDGKTFVVADESGTATLYDFATAERVASVQCDDPMWKIAFHPKGEAILTVSRRTCRQIPITSFLPHVELDPEPTLAELRAAGTYRRVFAARHDRDRTWRNRDAHWNVPAGATVIRPSGPPFAVGAWSAVFDRQFRWRVNIDTNTFKAQVVSADTGEVLHTSPIDRVYAADFSADGQYLALAEFTGTVHLLSTDTWETVRQFHRSEEELSAIDSSANLMGAVLFSPDSSLLAVGYLSGVISLWNVETGAHKGDLTLPQGIGMCMDFSADGSLLASGGASDEITIWSLSTFSELARMTGHQRPITDVEFSPDTQRVLSASLDGTVKLWETKSGREVITVFQFPTTRSPLMAAFSPKGYNVLAVLDNGEAHIAPSFPWNADVYPGPADMPFGDRNEWWRRERRLGYKLTAADISPEYATNPVP